MFVEERHKVITDLLEQNGNVKVKELSEQFQVTEDCIRKDLQLLEKKGLLKRTYGGAVKIRVNPHDLYVSQRKNKHLDDKIKIAEKALKMIKDGDMIFLDISTANIELAKQLVELNLNITIVTNMIEVMLALTVTSNIEVIFIGGTMNKEKEGFTGNMADQLISNFLFDIAFLGCVGINLENNNVDTYAVQDGITKNQIISCSKRAYLLLETRKFNMDGTYKYSSIHKFTGIITEKELDNKTKKLLERYKIEYH